MDPKNPSTWTPEQRVDYLASLGLNWVSGNGDTAVWKAPNGQTFSEKAAIENTLGLYAEGKPIGSGATAALAPDRTTQVDNQGRVYNIGTNGRIQFQTDPVTGEQVYGQVPQQPLTFQQQQQLAATPRVSVSQSIQDPAALQLQREQLAQSGAQFQQQLAATQAAADRAYQQQQEQLQQAGMLNMYNIAFNDKKQAFAEASDNKHLALQAQQMQQDLTFRQQDLQLKQQTLDYQYATFNATAQNEAAKFNAQMALQTQQANQQFETQKQDRLANIATQAGALAQNPGDIGKLAATLTANSGWGQANSALSGQDFRTDQSKTPLESLLRTRQDVQGQQAPYSYSPVQAQQLAAPPQVAGMPTLATLMGAQPQPQQPPAPNATPAPTTPAIDYSPAAQQARIDASRAAGSGAGGGMASAATGGVLSNAMRKVGERGPELQIDLADGRTMVLNDKQQTALAKAGLDLTEHTQGYASGGLYDNAFSNVQDTNRDLSTGFLNDAYSRAVSGTPWANQKQLPSPVWLSSPGTNPLTEQLVGSLKALGEGVPADTTSYLANLYRPVGARELVTGRTR